MRKEQTMKLMRIEGPSAWALSPLAGLEAWSDEIGRLLGRTAMGPGRCEDGSVAWVPPLDVREEKDDVVVTVELPGVRKEDIEVAVRDGVLTISGQRVREEVREDAGLLREERLFGRFQRSVVLPRGMVADGVRATYRDGVLTVRVPKPEEVKPRRIEVNVA
jgi:HSP20 family protein